MKISDKNIALIRKSLKYLREHFNVEYDDKEIEIGNDEIFIQFPDEEYIEEGYSIDDIIRYTKDIQGGIQIVEKHTVICGNIRQTIIDFDEYYYYHRVPNITFKTEQFTAKIIDAPFLIALVAARDGYYNTSFNISPCSSYMALEVTCKEQEVDVEKYMKFVSECLFYIAYKYLVSVRIGEFLGWDDITDESNDSNVVITEKDLFSYNNAMEYYTRALSIMVEDLKFIHLYKVIEHLSPFIAKKSAYEKMTEQLSVLSEGEITASYIESIFSLSKQYDTSLKDKELAFTAIRECTNIIQLFKYLPQTIQRRIYKMFRLQLEDIPDVDVVTVQSIGKYVGDCIYATRNSIVHAKANYHVSGLACPIQEYAQLNDFMIELCKSLFEWYEKQPNYLKII